MHEQNPTARLSSNGSTSVRDASEFTRRELPQGVAAAAFFHGFNNQRMPCRDRGLAHARPRRSIVCGIKFSVWIR
jgi:hypothetical protein